VNKSQDILFKMMPRLRPGSIKYRKSIPGNVRQFFNTLPEDRTVPLAMKGRRIKALYESIVRPLSLMLSEGKQTSSLSTYR
jgi:hypothetical protein